MPTCRRAKAGGAISLLVAGLFLPAILFPFLPCADSFAAQRRRDSERKVTPGEGPQDKTKLKQKERERREQILQERIAGSLEAAIRKNKASLERYREKGDRFNETETLSKLGTLYDFLGEKKTALEHYEQALAVSREIKFKRGEAYILNGLAAAHYSIAEKQKALDYYEQALPLFLKGFDPKEFNYSFTVEGVYGDLEIPVINYYEATELPTPSLDPSARPMPPRKTPAFKPDPEGHAVTVNGLGQIYADLGEAGRAIEYFNKALALWKSGNKEGEAATLNNMGGAYRVLGDLPKASEYYQRSLKLRREIGDRRGEAITLNNIGAIYDALQDRKNALVYYQQALPIFREQGDRKGEAMALNNIGTSDWVLGEKLKAAQFYGQALAVFREIRDRAGETNALYNIAIVERDMGRFDQARSNIEAAIEIIEHQRASIKRQELRASFFASTLDCYELYADLLMQLYKLKKTASYQAAALQAVESARARTLLELLAEAGADIRQGVEPSLLERERSLQRLITAKSERQIQLLNGKHTPGQAEAMKKEMDELLAEHEQAQAQIRARSPRYAELTQPRPLSAKQIQQQVLDADTLLLEYALGKNRSYVWAVTPTEISSYELPGRDEIESAARSFYELLIAPNEQVGPQSRGLRVVKAQAQDAALAEAGSRLRRMILDPVSKHLGKKRLLIVADGALQYVPFAALPEPPLAQAKGEGSQPLIVNHEILSLPSASTLAAMRQESRQHVRPSGVIAVLADPVFDITDERVSDRRSVQPAKERPASARDATSTVNKPFDSRKEKEFPQPGLGLQRLPGTKREAEEILALVAGQDRLEALDFKASRDTATGKELEGFRYLHFATHGFLDSVRPELSGIVLSMVDEKGSPENGFLLAHEIYNLRLPAELVVLSACQTGLGKQIRGEGLVGMTRGFLYAGARRVVVSLWSVDDEATKELMVAFYKGMLKAGLNPAAALREAQIKMWKQKRWQSPYYWAAFIMQGEYLGKS